MPSEIRLGMTRKHARDVVDIIYDTTWQARADSFAMAGIAKSLRAALMRRAK